MIAEGIDMAIVIFWKQRIGDRWVVIRRHESPENATMNESVEGEFNSDQETEADALLQELTRENRMTEAKGSVPPAQDEPESS
ncbi:MAG: hypothetical protein WD208_03465 [Dehalococcoidia bacterium]